MKEISQAEVDNAMALAPKRKEKEKEISVEDFEKLLTDMQNPVNAQKDIAVKVKLFIDKRIKDEMEQKGVLGDNTRKWIETYTTLLDRLQKAIHGDKTLNLHVHQITHGEIAAKMRESVIVLDKKKKRIA